MGRRGNSPSSKFVYCATSSHRHLAKPHFFPTMVISSSVIRGLTSPNSDQLPTQKKVYIYLIFMNIFFIFSTKHSTIASSVVVTSRSGDTYRLAFTFTLPAPTLA